MKSNFVINEIVPKNIKEFREFWETSLDKGGSRSRGISINPVCPGLQLHAGVGDLCMSLSIYPHEVNYSITYKNKNISFIELEFDRTNAISLIDMFEEHKDSEEYKKITEGQKELQPLPLADKNLVISIENVYL